MRALIPILSGIGTILGAFFAAYRIQRAAHQPPGHRSFVGPVIAVAVVVTLCIVTVLMAIAVMD